jgi:hypothetical protein
MMEVTKKSVLSGVTRTKTLDITQEQLDRWKGGELIQHVFPHLTADEREFLMTGASSEEWKEYMAAGDPYVEFEDD